MTTTLLVDRDMSVTLGRNDMWAYKANPYQTASNYEKLRSIGIDIGTFEVFAKKMGYCTSYIHFRQMILILLLMLLVPIVTLVMGILKGIPVEVILYIVLGFEVVLLIFVFYYYLRFQPILYRRAKLLTEVESEKSGTTGIEYKMSGCGFRLIVTKKAGSRVGSDDGTSNEISPPDSSILEEIHNIPMLLVLVHTEEDKKVLGMLGTDMKEILQNVRYRDVKQVLEEVRANYFSVGLAHEGGCCCLLIALPASALLLYGIVGVALGCFLNNFEILLYTGLASLIVGILVLIILFIYNNSKFKKAVRKEVEVRNNTTFRRYGLYVDLERAHYMISLFVFNRRYQPDGGSYETDPRSNKFFK